MLLSAYWPLGYFITAHLQFIKSQGLITLKQNRLNKLVNGGIAVAQRLPRGQQVVSNSLVSNRGDLELIGKINGLVNHLLHLQQRAREIRLIRLVAKKQLDSSIFESPFEQLTPAE